MPEIANHKSAFVLNLLLLVLSFMSTTSLAGNELITVAGTKPTIWANITQAKGATKPDAQGNIYITNSDQHRVLRVDSQGNVTTFAGTGNSGYSGDNDLATKANLQNPEGLSLDADGNLFIADTGNHVIRKVDTNGIITTVAGDGTGGFSGDSNLAVNAQLNEPNDMTINTSGEIFIADTANHRIRKVDTNGIITTLAGTNTAGFSGDNGDSTLAQLDTPKAITFDDSDNLVIADTNNHRIRQISPVGNITTRVGTGDAGFSGDNGNATLAELEFPNALVFASSGDLYIADANRSKVRKIDATTQVITTIAGSGSTGFANNGQLATDSQTRLIIEDLTFGKDNEFIILEEFVGARTIDNIGNISTWLGQSSSGFTGDTLAANSAHLYRPMGLAEDKAGNLYFADTYNQRIRRIDNNGVITTIAGNGQQGYTGDNGLAINASFNYPHDIVIHENTLYIADTDNSVIRQIDLSTGLISTLAGVGTCGFDASNVNAATTPLCQPTSLIVSSNNELIFADSNNFIVRSISANGQISTIAGTPEVSGLSGINGVATSATLGLPRSLTLSRTGELYIADEDNNAIFKINQQGIISQIAGGGNSLQDKIAATDADLKNPLAIVFDLAGNLYVTSSIATLRKIDTNLIINDVVCDCKGNRDGTINSIAEINIAYGLFTDKKGNLFIGDTENDLIRKIAYIPVSAGDDGLIFLNEDADAVAINVLNNDLVGEAAMDVTQVSITQQPTSGTLSVDEQTGIIRYLPLPNIHGDDTFKYQVADVNGVTSNEATVTLQIKEINDVPVIKPFNNLIVSKNQSVSQIIEISDIETPAEELVVFGISADSSIVRFENIRFTGSGAQREMQITPNADTIGQAKITLTVQDAINAKSTFEFEITVTDTPNTPIGSDDNVIEEIPDDNTNVDNTEDESPANNDQTGGDTNESINNDNTTAPSQESGGGGGGSVSWTILLLGLLITRKRW